MAPDAPADVAGPPNRPGWPPRRTRRRPRTAPHAGAADELLDQAAEHPQAVHVERQVQDARRGGSCELTSRHQSPAAVALFTLAPKSTSAPMSAVSPETATTAAAIRMLAARNALVTGTSRQPTPVRRGGRRGGAAADRLDAARPSGAATALAPARSPSACRGPRPCGSADRPASVTGSGTASGPATPGSSIRLRVVSACSRERSSRPDSAAARSSELRAPAGVAGLEPRHAGPVTSRADSGIAPSGPLGPTMASTAPVRPAKARKTSRARWMSRLQIGSSCDGVPSSRSTSAAALSSSPRSQ